MPGENEVLAVFKADIEQYKAQMAELGVTNKAAEKSTDAVTDSTKTYEKTTKSAAGSIGTLSKGLGGVAGLLGVTGRLFGVNTDKIEALVFASRQFVKVGQDISKAQKLAGDATQAATKAQVASTVATKASTVAGSASAGIWGIVAAAIGVAVISIYEWVKGAAAAKKTSEDLAKSTEDLNTAFSNISSREDVQFVSKFDTEIKSLDKQIQIAEKLLADFNPKLKGASQEELKKNLEDIEAKQAEIEKLRIARRLAVVELERESIKKEVDAAKRGNIEKIQDEIRILGQQKNVRTIFRNKEGLEQDLTFEQTISRNQFLKEQIDALEEESTNKQNERSVKVQKLKDDQQDKDDAARKIREAAEKASLDRQFAAFVKYYDDLDKKAAERIKKSIEEQKTLQENAQKLLEEQFTEEQDSAFKGRAEAQQEVIDKAKKGIEDYIDLLRVLKETGNATIPQLEALAEIEDDINKKRIESAQQVSDAIFKAQQEAFDKRQELLDQEIDLQAQNIETQQKLAEQGLTNTLAFEEKRAADLRRQQIVEAQKQKRVKLLETFLNSLAEFSKTDPKTAIQKALLQVALAQAASAVFAEEGGIIGEIGERSNLRRKHKGGGDVLLHAQTGEGILSREEISNLGRRNFHLLKDAARFPVKDNIFAMPQVAIAGGMQPSNAEVVKELKTLQSIIRRKKETSYNLDQFGNYVKTQVEEGVKTVTKGKLRKTRFK